MPCGSQILQKTLFVLAAWKIIFIFACIIYALFTDVEKGNRMVRILENIH